MEKGRIRKEAGRRKKKERRRTKGGQKKEEGKRKAEGRRKKEERTAALVMEASLTGLGGQGLAWSHIRSAS